MGDGTLTGIGTGTGMLILLLPGPEAPGPIERLRGSVCGSSPPLRWRDLVEPLESERERASRCCCCCVPKIFPSCLGVEYKSMGPESGRDAWASARTSWTWAYGSFGSSGVRERGAKALGGGESRAVVDEYESIKFGSIDFSSSLGGGGGGERLLASFPIPPSNTYGVGVAEFSFEDAPSLAAPNAPKYPGPSNHRPLFCRAVFCLLYRKRKNAATPATIKTTRITPAIRPAFG